MTIYTSMQLHIERHMYKRGKHKGTAPLDGSRRSRNHERVRKLNDGSIAVRFHETDVITVNPDDSFTLDCRDWFASPTTRNCMNDAFRKFDMPVSVYNGRKFSKSQQIVRVSGVEHRYYDGITFAADGTLLSKNKPFEAKRIDKSETKELYDGLKESGFKDVFKLLHAASAVEHEAWTNEGGPVAPQLRDVLTNADLSHNWPGVVRRYAFDFAFDWASRSPQYTKTTAGKTWTAIMNVAKGDLYRTVIAK